MEDTLEIELYDKIRSRLSDDGARELVRFIEKNIANGFEAKKDLLATKKDISLLKEEIANLRASNREDMASLRADLRVEIAQSKADLIKWMFIFLIGQAAAIISVLKLLK